MLELTCSRLWRWRRLVLDAGLGAVADADDGGVVLGEAHDAPLPRRLRARADLQHVAEWAVRRAVRCAQTRGLDNLDTTIGQLYFYQEVVSVNCVYVLKYIYKS